VWRVLTCGSTLHEVLHVLVTIMTVLSYGRSVLAVPFAIHKLEDIVRGTALPIPPGKYNAHKSSMCQDALV
jgi:hypothetical protein